MTDMMIQPIVSSMIADATMTWPTVRRREADLAHDHRHDLHRRDRQRGTKEQCRDQPLVRIGQHRVGQQLAEQHAAGKGTTMPAIETLNAPARVRRHEPRSVSMPVSKSSKQNAELRDRVDHRLLLGI